MAALEAIVHTERAWGMIVVYVIVLAMVAAMALDNKHNP